MMNSPLITVEQLTLAYGTQILFDKTEFKLFPKERVCLIGRNGAGKSSLLKILSDNLSYDNGHVWFKPNLRIARLEQELPFQCQDLTVYQWVAQGLADIGQLLAEFHLLTQNLGHCNDDVQLQRMAILQQQLETKNAWQYEQIIETHLQRLELPKDRLLNELSGGWQRRASLARALVSEPEVLLLDEPTNHLDIEAIAWLEDELPRFQGSIIFITHDRALLKHLATRIIELDRGQIISFPGNYDQYLKRKEELLAAENKANEEFDKKLAAEEKWIRQGIKARRTRNEGRVRSLKEMRLQRAARKEQLGKANFKMDNHQRSGELVIEAQHIHQNFNEKIIIKNFSARIMRGDRIGLIGPNGVGKSTLLNILLKKLTPEQGTVNLGTRLQIAYSDQLRQSLDPEKSIIDNIVQGREIIEIAGQKLHYMAYLSNFLFTPQRARMPIKALSGGEQNRVVLADLFSRPTNLLVLDEPTNDLDIETLELLEELLLQYQGTLLLVSHDRAFVNNVVTSVYAFEGQGKITEYIGGYDEWYRQQLDIKNNPSLIKKNIPLNKNHTNQNNVTSRSHDNTNRTHDNKLFHDGTNTTTKVQNQNDKTHANTLTLKSNQTNSTPTNTNRKLSSKEQRELKGIPTQIDLLEKRQQQLSEEISKTSFYQQPNEQINQVMIEMKEIDNKIQSLYQKWEELENRNTMGN